jgi:hypothetical protein
LKLLQLQWPVELISKLFFEEGGFGNTFIGCTGSGTPKHIPVNMFHRPEKTRVVEREMELLTARAIMSGSKVPRSPNDPDISVRGLFRRVLTLLM